MLLGAGNAFKRVLEIRMATHSLADTIGSTVKSGDGNRNILPFLAGGGNA